MQDRQYSLVTVAHESDFTAMALQARSLAMYCSADLISEIILVENFKDDSNFSWRAPLLQEYGKLGGLVRFISASHFGRVPKAEGWWTQQLFKLLVADDVKSDVYLVLDAKNHLVSPLRRSFLEDDQGRAKIYVEAYRGHPLQLYFNQSCAYFGIDDQHYIDRFITTAPPFLMYRDQVRNLRKYVESRENRSFVDFFLIGKNLTEFFLYGAYLVSVDALDRLYELNDFQCPVIWGHTTSKDDVIRLINESDVKQAPFFGIHRTAYGRFNDNSIQHLADYWTRKNLFSDSRHAVSYIKKMRADQRRQMWKKSIFSLSGRITSKIKRVMRVT